jgi:hypothetical protein
MGSYIEHNSLSTCVQRHMYVFVIAIKPIAKLDDQHLAIRTMNISSLAEVGMRSTANHRLGLGEETDTKYNIRGRTRSLYTSSLRNYEP